MAETIGGNYEGFAELMNKKAQELGLKNTHFVTPHGLDDPKHYTTAKELAILTDYALENEQFAKIVNTRIKTILINGKQKELSNTNELLGNLEGVNGVKTGFTNNAGRCLVCSCNRNGMNIISVVLGADTKKFRTKDSIEIIEFVYANYKKIDLGEIIEKEFKKWEENFQKNVLIEKGEEQVLKLKWNNPYKEFPIKKDEIDKIKIEIDAQNNFIAPVSKNNPIGQIKIYIGSRKLNTLQIFTKEAIKRKNFLEYFKEIIGVYANV